MKPDFSLLLVLLTGLTGLVWLLDSLLLKRRRMDRAVQKAVEIGVHSLVPVVTERVQLPWKAVVGRLGHWLEVRSHP